MKRLINLLFLGLSLTTLSGQIYTTKLQAPDGGTVAVDDVSFGPQGQVNIGYMEYVTINPNIPIIANVPWLARFNKRLNHDTLAQPLDSFPITSHHLTSLQSGDLLVGFSGGGFNGYNWVGYSYAILDSGYQAIQKAFGTSATQLFLRHSMPLGDSIILGIVYQYHQSDSLMLINPYSGHIRWSIPRVPGLPSALTHIKGAYRFSDSLRVFLNDGGSDLPCPRWNQYLHMVTLHRSNGAIGLSRPMSDTLISVGQVRPSPVYGLIYLDKVRENLTLEKRDSSWQVSSSSRINISTLLRQSQLPGYRLFTEPQVLKNGQGVGFLVSSGGITNADTVYYMRLDFSGQLRQKERVDSLPSAIRECRSLSGPDGSYFAIIDGSYILKAQPRNRISLPASEAIYENLQVSPLPATARLQVQLPAATGGFSHTYRLYGLSGQMYRQGQLTFSRRKATLNLHGLPRGSFILILEAGEKQYRARVMLE